MAYGVAGAPAALANHDGNFTIASGGTVTVEASAALMTGYAAPKATSWLLTQVSKVKTAFQSAAVLAVNLDGLVGGGLGAGIQKVVEPATTLSSMGWGAVYGTDATFLLNFAKKLKKEFPK